MFRPIKVTFHLDGTGLYYDYHEPLMLDGILAASLSRWHVHGEPPTRNEKPDDIPLPLRKWEKGGTWGWHASALFPDDEATESMLFWRKKFRQNRAEWSTGSPNITNGIYRDWNHPLPMLLTHKMTGYAVGDMGKVRMELRRSVKYLGKKRAHGRGMVLDVEVTETDNDYSMVKDGIAMRWLPHKQGSRIVRPRPPYWNMHDRVVCCNVGDRI